MSAGKSKSKVWLLPPKDAHVPTSGQLEPSGQKPNLHKSTAKKAQDHKHLAPLQVTAVYDTYWRFAAERQRVYMQRVANQPAPWTADPIISIHKFTNAYRASDRVSQYLIQRVIYRDDLPKSPEEVLFRILLFKLFNKIETWELLERHFGEVTLAGYKFKYYDHVLANAKAAGERIYSAAYIMPPGSAAYGYAAKHQNHLQLLEQMCKDKLALKLGKLRRMQQGFELLKAYPTIGDFLAYQFIVDVNYSEITDFPEMEFVVAGPGAKDGLKKCFTHTAGLNEPELIRLMADLQTYEFERLGLKFESIWGRQLQLIDCQNLFCEVDKYSRVAHPDISGISGRSRIKQKFVSSGLVLQPWYPPKWNLNDRIAADPRLQASLKGTRPQGASTKPQFELPMEAPIGLQ